MKDYDVEIVWCAFANGKFPRAIKPARHAGNPFQTQWPNTLRKVRYEAFKMDASYVAIALACSEGDLRRDGQGLKADTKLRNQGVILTFHMKKGPPAVFPCDHFSDWHRNVHAAALTIERLRLADLYGVADAGQQFAGFRSLPGPLVTPAPMTPDEAAVWIGNEGGPVPYQSVLLSADTFRACFRRAAKRFHPDVDPSQADKWARLQQAQDTLNKHHGI
jgi:hypothetical protein